MLSTIPNRPLMGTAGRRPTWLVALVSLALLVAAFLMAAMVGLGAWVPVFGLLGLIGFGALIAFGILEPGQKVLSGVLLLVLATTLVHPVVSGALGLPIGYVFELLCFGLLIGGAAAGWRRFGRSPWFQWLVFLTFLYFVLGAISSVAGRSKPMAALWQLQYNLKLPAMFLIGLMLAYTATQQRFLKWFVAWAWLPIGAMVAIEMFFPSVFVSVMNQELDHTINPIIGVGVRRAGLFPHSGYMALTVAMLGWMACVWAIVQRRWHWLLPMLAYCGLLLLAGQRQEAAAFVMAIGVLVTFYLRKHWRVIMVGGSLAAGVIAVVMLLTQVSLGQKLLSEWGAGEQLERVSERYVLTQAGNDIGRHYMPLGSGLGTYGGAGAQKFDQSQFIDLGFDRYWWFRQGMFLVDVYWPSVIAEAGYFGATSWLLALLLLTLLLVRSIWRTGGHEPLAWIAAGGIILLIGNSPTSAALTDPRLTFWIWLLIGAGARLALTPPEERAA